MDQYELEDPEIIEKRIEEYREWRRKANRDSWIALIVSIISLIVSILRLLQLVLPLLR